MKKLLLLLLLSPLSILAQNKDDVYGPEKTKEARVKDSTYNAGSEAAKIYFKSYKGAASATLLVSVLSPILGLAPAIGTTSDVPGNLMHPGNDNLKIPQYYLGYTDQAKKIRSRKVWGNWAIGSAVSIGITAAVIAILKSNSKVDNSYNQPQAIPRF